MPSAEPNPPRPGKAAPLSEATRIALAALEAELGLESPAPVPAAPKPPAPPAATPPPE